jgi:hypothetical protein
MASTSASMVNPMVRVVEIPIGLGHVGSGGNDGLRDVVEAIRRIAGRLEPAAGATFPTTPEGGVNVSEGSTCLSMSPLICWTVDSRRCGPAAA